MTKSEVPFLTKNNINKAFNARLDNNICPFL